MVILAAAFSPGCPPRAPASATHRRAAWLWLALLLWTGPLLAARIEASLDRNPVPLNESFTLTLAADESPDGEPDFSPLARDFEIIDQNQSNQFSIVNGKASRSIEWRLTLMAKRAGTLEIPAIAFGADRSNPFAVTILAASGGGRPAPTDDGEVLVEVDVEPKHPYVQSQVIYTLRVLSRVAFGEARLGGPEAEDALIEKLDGERQGLVTRNGVQYRVNEIRYAISPQKSGALQLAPARLEIQLGGGGGFPFGPFFNRPTKSKRLQSEAVELEVRPIPPAFQGKHWLPAAKLELEDSWAQKPPEVAAGEPITRTLTLKAEGATVGLLPELNPESSPPGELKRYPDQPILKEEKRAGGFASLRQEKIALIAPRPGTYRLPALEIPWWNTRADRMEVARLPERVLTVLPAAGAKAPEPPPGTAPAIAAGTPAPPTPEAPEAPAAAPMPEPDPIWFRLSLLFGIGWLATALAWWHSAARRAPRAAAPEAGTVNRDEQRLVRALELACGADEPAAAKRALAAWTAWRGLDLTDPERWGGAELSREVGALNRALYAPGGSEWRGEGLWRGFRSLREATPPGREPGARKMALEPLYKI